MKVFVIVLLIVEVVGALFLVKKIFFSPQKSSEKKYTYYVEGKRVKLMLADNPFIWAKGLMFYRKLDNADGMVFLFPDTQMRTFWNKNTYMDLDVYWYHDDKLLGKDFLPSTEKSRNMIMITSPKPANKVIELVHEE